MGLIDTINSDIANITSNLNDFGVSMTFIAPDLTTLTVTGIHTKHHLGVNTEGEIINSKKASIAVSESKLAGYPLRNAKNEVDLNGHLVNVKDSTGTLCNYKIRQWFPDETIGLIVCILEMYVSE